MCKSGFDESYITMTDDLDAGVLLFWLTREAKNRNPGGWITRQEDAWCDELRLTQRRYNSAIKLLYGLKFITIDDETRYIKLNYNMIIEEIKLGIIKLFDPDNSKTCLIAIRE